MVLRKIIIDLPQKVLISSTFLLSLLLIFEFLIAKLIIPNYLIIRKANAFLFISIISLLLFSNIFKKKLLVYPIFISFIFFIIRIFEIWKIIPRIHNPDIIMSIFILSGFLSIYIILFYTQITFNKVLHFFTFVLAILYQILFYRKLFDLSPLILVFSLSFTIGLSFISLLLKLEQKRKNEIDSLYKQELDLKRKIALMRGRMIEQEKSFSLSLMTAGIAHEIGNPINHLQGNLRFLDNYLKLLSQMVNEEQLSEHDFIQFQNIQKDYRSIIKYSIDGFDNINDVITNIKQLYGKGHKGKEITNINSLVRRTVQFFKTTHKIDFHIELDLDRNLYAEIIPGDYHIVLSNILNNAAESFNHEKKKSNQIKIKLYNNKLINLEISDNGKGILPENIDKIFDPFFSTKEKDFNLGIGLALSREIVQTDGNNLEILSSYGKGTTVILTLKEYKQ